MTIDRKEIEAFLNHQPPISGVPNTYAVLHAHCTALLGTIPADQSSAEYALWLLSQGKKITLATWNAHDGCLYLDDNGVLRWNTISTKGDRFNSTLAVDIPWLEWTPPVVVDQEALNKKCREYVAKCMTGHDRACEFTDAERAELMKESP